MVKPLFQSKIEIEPHWLVLRWIAASKRRWALHHLTGLREARGLVSVLVICLLQGLSCLPRRSCRQGYSLQNLCLFCYRHCSVTPAKQFRLSSSEHNPARDWNTWSPCLKPIPNAVRSNPKSLEPSEKLETCPHALIAAERHRSYGSTYSPEPKLQVQQPRCRFSSHQVVRPCHLPEPSPETFESGFLGSTTMRIFLEPKAPQSTTWNALLDLCNVICTTTQLMCTCTWIQMRKFLSLVHHHSVSCFCTKGHIICWSLLWCTVWCCVWLSLHVADFVAKMRQQKLIISQKNTSHHFGTTRNLVPSRRHGHKPMSHKDKCLHRMVFQKWRKNWTRSTTTWWTCDSLAAIPVSCAHICHGQNRVQLGNFCKPIGVPFLWHAHLSLHIIVRLFHQFDHWGPCELASSPSKSNDTLSLGQHLCFSLEQSCASH